MEDYKPRSTPCEQNPSAYETDCTDLRYDLHSTRFELCRYFPKRIFQDFCQISQDTKANSRTFQDEVATLILYVQVYSVTRNEMNYLIN